MSKWIVLLMMLATPAFAQAVSGSGSGSSVQIQNPAGQSIGGSVAAPIVTTAIGSFAVSCPANPISKKVPPLC